MRGRWGRYGGRRRCGKAIASLLVALAFAFPIAPAARGNGRYPASNALLVAPGPSRSLVLRATFGLLLSADSGAHWDWVCESAIGYGGPNSVEDPSLGITTSGAILAGLFEGLAVSPDTGCRWAFVGGSLAGQVIIDLVVRPDTPSTALALTSTFAGDGGRTAFRSQIFVTTDNGKDWVPYGAPLDPAVQTETVEVAKTDPHRVYVSGERRGDGGLTGSLFVSTDDAQHWTERPIPLDASTFENGAYVAAVDPTNADRIYVRTSSLTSGRLLVTADAGATFTSVYHGGPLLGFALTADGSRVYVGGLADGLHVASSANLAFTKRSSIQLQCLAVGGATLYACSSEVSGFVLGASTNEGASWSPLVHLSTIRGPLACPSGTSSAACVAEWPALATQLGVGSVADAGMRDGREPIAPGDGSPDAGVFVPPVGRSCGCRTAGAPVRRGAVGLAFGAVGLALSWRRRRGRGSAGRGRGDVSARRRQVWAKGAVRIARGAADDAVMRVERVDHPAVTGVEADVPRPPEDVADAHVLE